MVATDTGNTVDTRQSLLNIGTLGHIDHGKTSLTRAITNVWTDRHSESVKRNMTIKLGYADAIIRKCPNCKAPECYTTSDKCKNCGSEARPLMRISMIDAPGHETLMATAISGSSIIDAILFVIAANEPCPMQQTKEHLMIINLLGITNAIIVQSKVDIVGKEAALKHYAQIKQFVKGSSIENAPIVPVMTNHGINVDVVLEKIVETPRPKRDLESQPLMYVVRSFDVNKPGIDATTLTGGVVGGAIVKGKFKVGDQVEIKPGMKSSAKGSKKENYTPILTKIIAMSNGEDDMKEAVPGGLIGLSTEIDPTFAKADGLVGNVVGHAGKLPESASALTLTYHKLNRTDLQESGMKEDEVLILGIGTATAIGYIKKIKRDMIEVELKRPVAMLTGVKIPVMRSIGQRWKLTGYGVL
jgi:translation initiation factor 2 subunit 3